MSTTDGHNDPRFDGVRAALDRHLSSGEELGASLVVDVDGETVVDVWGGHRDAARTTAWDEHTIANVWSSTKTVTALAVLVLADRGDVDLDAPVAAYWPEFAANDKGDIRVRHLLSHTSGLSGLDQPVTVTDLYDQAAVTARFAAQAPWWEPGTASGYHATVYGHLAGEVVRRVSGRSLRAFVTDEIAGPLDADFRIGATEKDTGRIAEMVAPPPSPFDLAALPPDSVLRRTFTGPAVDATVANTDAWRRADLGAVNGHGNARSLARIQSVVARGGTVDGVRLLSPHTIERIFDEQANGVDLVLGIPLRWGIGYALPLRDTLSWIPDGRICFWGGWGGSMIIMDLDRRMTIAYVMNRMGAGIIGSDRSRDYITAVYDALR